MLRLKNLRNYMKTMGLNKLIRNQKGFSVLELLIVVLVISILMVFASRFASAKVYMAEKEANKLTDIFREARQKALTQHETMRVEINQYDRTIRLINENKPGDGSDDKEIRKLFFADEQNVVFDRPPANMAARPEEPVPVPDLNFKTPITFEAKSASYAMAMDASAEASLENANPVGAEKTDAINEDDKIATYRFLKNGNVVDAGMNAVGDNAMITGATIFFWTPVTKNGKVTEDAAILRAVTLLGSSGSTRFWKCPIIDGRCANWEK